MLLKRGMENGTKSETDEKGVKSIKMEIEQETIFLLWLRYIWLKIIDICTFGFFGQTYPLNMTY